MEGIKLYSIMLVSLLLGTMFIGLFIFSDECLEPVEAANLYVGGTGLGNYTKIQDAIDNATTGDTIRIQDGMYFERFIVHKTLTIIGNSTGAVIIDGSGTNQDIILVTADWVNITGLTVNNSGISATCGGITLVSADNCHLYGNVFTNNNIGIHITSDSNYNTAEDNIFKDNPVGYRVYSSSDYNKLFNNTITTLAGGVGIGFDGSSNNIASGNDVGYCNYAMNFWSGSNNEANDNLLYNSTHGIHFQSTSNCLATNNTIWNNTYGAYANSGSTNLIYHNSFFTNTNHSFDGGTNSWNNSYPSGGNYWDNYTGTDNYHGPAQNIAGSDGIGDTPFSPMIGVIDNYPFITPNGDFLRKFPNGNGTSESPYQISNVSELQWMGKISNLNKHYIIVNKINATETNSWNNNSGFNPIGNLTHRFLGSLDGREYNITGLFINRTTTDYVGLFGFTGNDANLNNISLLDTNISGQSLIGGIMGHNEQSERVNNCHVTGLLSGTEYVGGIVGFNMNGVFSNCTTTAIINGTGYVGGFVGDSLVGAFSYCNTTGDVNGGDYVGGFGGAMVMGGSISDCHSTGDVNGSAYVGGFIGDISGVITNCSSSGEVTGNGAISGFASNWNSATITDCHSTGNVTGTDGWAGGFSTVNMGVITRCFSTGNVNGTKSVGGFVASNGGGITICSSTGDVRAEPTPSFTTYIGGFAGTNGGWINNCSSTGDVNNTNLYVNDFGGGFVGVNYDSIIDCFSTGKLLQITNPIYTGGFGGHDFGTTSNCFYDYQTSGVFWGNGAQENSTFEMMQQKTFKGWDFDKVWGIYEANTYPFLRAFGSPPSPIADLNISIEDSHEYRNIGDTLHYYVNVTNNGSDNSAFVEAKIELPSQVIFNSSNQSVDLIGQNLTWNIGTLNRSTIVNCEINVTVNSSSVGKINCTANVTALTFDPGFYTNKSWVETLINRAPIAFNDTYFTDEDTILNVFAPGILGNDTDLDIDNLTVITHDTPSALGAKVLVNPTGSFNYDPTGLQIFHELAVGESLSDFFNYTISDGKGRTSNATVNITINGANDKPVTNNDTLAIDEDTVLVSQAPGLLGNDSDPDASDTIQVISYDDTTPMGATVTVNADGGFIYDPTSSDLLQALPVGSYVIDSFEYTVSDNNGGFKNATVYVNVTGANDRPIANDDGIIVFEDSGVKTIDVLVNDTDIDDDTINILQVTQGYFGKVKINSSGTGLTYKPNPDYYGEDNFTYIISDGHGGIDTAMVNVTITNINDPPLISEKPNITATEDIEFSVDYDPVDIDPFSKFKWGLHTNAGWLWINSDTGVLNGTPSNDDVGQCWVNITLSDGYGGLTYHNFTLTIVNTNDAPVITFNSLPNAIEDLEYEFDLTSSDVDVGDILTWTLVSGPSWLNLDGSTIVGTPSNFEVGIAWVVLEIQDTSNALDQISLQIIVENTNDGPVWIRTLDDQNITEGDALILECKATDEDGDNITFSIITTPTSNLTINPSSGAIKWASPKVGIYNAIITASDGIISIQNTFTINVNAPPDKSEIDTDDDDIPDWWEDLYGLDPNNATDANGDPDNDNIINIDEFKGNTSPLVDDSDVMIDKTDDDTGGIMANTILFYAIIIILAIIVIAIISILIKKSRSKSDEAPSEVEIEE